jgi:hypothetical protein
VPRKKRLAKEQRQYEYMKESPQKTGRYGQRAKEVAAHAVIKQRSGGKRKKK